MVVFGAALDLGVGFLLAIALAQYAKIKAEKGWNFLAISAALFLFSAAFVEGYFGAGELLESVYILKTIAEVLGWVSALIGAAFVVYEVLLEKTF